MFPINIDYMLAVRACRHYRNILSGELPIAGKVMRMKCCTQLEPDSSENGSFGGNVEHTADAFEH